MDNYSSRLIVINDKVNELLEEIALLKKEKNELNNSNLALNKVSQAHKLQLDDLNEKIQMLKLAKSISGDEKPQETTELKRKINEYIKEIDRCIALLNE
jgi:chromosome segregation ATPase